VFYIQWETEKPVEIITCTLQCKVAWKMPPPLWVHIHRMCVLLHVRFVSFLLSVVGLIDSKMWWLCLKSLFVVYVVTLFQRLRLYSVEWRRDKWMMNWKGCGRKWLWHNVRYYSSICLEELGKTTLNFQSGKLVSGFRFESRTFLIWDRCVNHSTTSFGVCVCLKMLSWNMFSFHKKATIGGSN
jgi:hypothetical protein